MKRDITDFLEDILAYSAKARELAETIDIRTLTEFSPEGLALIRCIEVIGEATKHIPDEIRVKYPEIPWKGVAGMRDILIHKYWAANMARAIETARQDFPQLQTVVQKILTDLNTEK
jgi:uncharacterized protein with HEPN domain